MSITLPSKRSLFCLLFLVFVTLLQVVWGMKIKEDNPENQRLFREVIHTHLTTRVSGDEAAHLIFLDLVIPLIGMFFLASVKNNAADDDQFASRVMEQEDLERFAQTLEKSVEEIKTTAQRYNFMQDDRLVIGLESRRAFLCEIGAKFHQVELYSKIQRNSVPKFIGLLQNFLGVGCIVGGVASLIYGLVRARGLSPLKIAQETAKGRVNRAKFWNVIFMSIQKLMLPLWFRRMKRDIKRFVVVDHDAKLPACDNKLFYSVFGNTKIPELFERAFKEEGKKILEESYVQTLAELAKELSEFYAGKRGGLRGR